jgi:hypothetical protein
VPNKKEVDMRTEKEIIDDVINKAKEKNAKR